MATPLGRLGHAHIQTDLQGFCDMHQHDRLTVNRTLPHFSMKTKSLLLSCVCVGGILLATTVFASICNMKTGCRPIKKHSSSSSSTTSVKMPSSGVFPSGMYYKEVSNTSQQSTLASINNSLPIRIVMPPGVFDIQKDQMVIADNMHTINIYKPDGQTSSVNVQGLYFIGRVSLSPDGKRVAVQASESAALPINDLNIYIVNLTDGKYQRISFLPLNEESPEWFHASNKIAYVSFSPQDGLRIHVYDADQKKEVLSIANAGGSQIAVSKDGKKILDPVRLKIYDAKSGKAITDVKLNVLAGLKKAGYRISTKFPGQANLGTFALDGDFSKDGKHIVMDGAVTKNGVEQILMFTVSSDGLHFTVLKSTNVDPSFSNNNNFSQLNPTWF